VTRTVRRSTRPLSRPELASPGFWRSLSRCTPGGAPCRRCGLPFARADRILYKLPLDTPDPICAVEGCRPSRVFQPRRNIGGREVMRSVERGIPLSVDTLAIHGSLDDRYDRARVLRDWIFDYAGEKA
jgi:hypothetical protein